MESKEKKCSSKDHSNISDINFCYNCRVYLCNKCLKIHKDLYDHILVNIDKDTKEIFTGFCEEENHQNKLDFYCQTHKKLCCAAYISKIKIKGNG